MKTSNDYAALFGQLYARTPKAVFAAVAYSFAHLHGAQTNFGIAPPSGGQIYPGPWNDVVIRYFLNEWKVLHENGIVPQEPPRSR